MIRSAYAVAALALGLAGYNQNTAIGNDREAAVDPEPIGASVEAANTALANVATGLIKPETMSAADVQKIAGEPQRCTFTLTEVGFPVFIYDPGKQGTIKLNGKLIPVKAIAPDRYASGKLLIVTHSLDYTGDAGLQAQELIVMPPGAKDELGYHGYVRCEDGLRG